MIFFFIPLCLIVILVVTLSARPGELMQVRYYVVDRIGLPPEIGGGCHRRRSSASPIKAQAPRDLQPQLERRGFPLSKRKSTAATIIL